MAVSKKFILNTLSVVIAASALIGCGRDFEATKPKKTSSPTGSNAPKPSPTADVPANAEGDQTPATAEERSASSPPDTTVFVPPVDSVSGTQPTNPPVTGDSLTIEQRDFVVPGSVATTAEALFLGLASYYGSEDLIVRSIVAFEGSTYIFTHLKKIKEMPEGQTIEMPLIGAIEKLTPKVENIIDGEMREVLAKSYSLSLNCAESCDTFIATMKSGEIVANATLTKDSRNRGSYVIDVSASLKTLKNTEVARQEILRNQVAAEAGRTLNLLRSIK